MTRHSVRLKTQAQVKPVQYNEDSDDLDAPGPSTRPLKRKRKDSSESPSAPSAPPAAGTGEASASSSTLVGVKDGGGKEKESHRPAKKVRGRRGMLQQLVEMPLELLFEIFGKLDPIDVLNLARSTKALRGILMSRSAADIWREALTNAPDLPACPPDLNEPQWVDLILGKNCHTCGRNNALTSQTYAWQARVRGCFKCVLAQFPYTEKRRVGYLSQSLYELIPSFTVRTHGRRSDRGVYYHGATYDEFVEMEKRLTNLEERKKWVDEQREAKAALVKHARLCEMWIDDRVKERANDLEALRQERKEVLRQKLEGLGYGSMAEMAFKREEFWRNTAVANAIKKDLTDRVWAGLADSVVAVLERFRDEFLRLQRDRNMKTRFQVLADAYKEYTENHPTEKLILSVQDIFRVSDIRTCILAEPLEEPLDPQVVQDILERIPELTETWCEEAYQNIADLMSPNMVELGLATVDKSSLDLAVAVFHCNRCYKKLFAQRAIWHKCLRAPVYTYPRAVVTDADLSAFCVYTEKTPWLVRDTHTVFLDFDKPGSLNAKAAVVMAGLDPLTATIEEMDALDPIYELTYPRDASFKGQTMMTWRGIALNHAPVPIADLTLQDEERSAIIRDLLNTEMRRTRGGGAWEKYIFCKQCMKYNGTSWGLRTHLKDVHNTDPARDEDVWLHPDQPDSRLSYLDWNFPGATLI